MSDLDLDAYHLVWRQPEPTPDPEADLAEEVEAALSLSHPVLPRAIHDVIAIVREHDARQQEAGDE